MQLMKQYQLTVQCEEYLKPVPVKPFRFHMYTICAKPILTNLNISIFCRSGSITAPKLSSNRRLLSLFLCSFSFLV